MGGDHRSETGKGPHDCDIYSDVTITIENGREHGDALSVQKGPSRLKIR